MCFLNAIPAIVTVAGVFAFLTDIITAGWSKRLQTTQGLTRGKKNLPRTVVVFSSA
jgi:hypothetical protein